MRAIIWEVDNTFGKRRGDLIPVEQHTGKEIVQRCDKAFNVSTLMDIDIRFEFLVFAPTDKLSVRIDTFDHEGLVLTVRHLAKRVKLTDASLLKVFLAIPFLTVSVLGGIYWEALKIWMKGIRPRARPRRARVDCPDLFP